jgi:Holliday junction resolvase
MGKSYSKTKGKAYERELCKHLSEVFDLNFERVPASGAFTGGKNVWRTGRLTPEQLLLSEGDIIVPGELAHCKFECKWYKEFSFSSLFENNSVLNEWIEQSKEGSDKTWFLAIKVNHKGQFLVFDKKLKSKFKLNESYLLYKNKYIMTKMDSFFESNKESILNL